MAKISSLKNLRNGEVIYPRTYTSAVYTNKGTPMSRAFMSLEGITAIPSNADIGSVQYRVPGNYYCETTEVLDTLKNVPGSIGLFTLYVKEVSGVVAQQINDIVTGDVYYRSLNASTNTFTNWNLISGKSIIDSLTALEERVAALENK